MGKGRWAAALILGGVVACSQPPAAPKPVVVPEPAVRTIADARALRANPDQYLRALAVLERSADPATSRRAQALHALFLFDAKRYADAVPMLEKAAVSNPAVAPFLRLRIAESDLALKNGNAAVAVLSEIIALDGTSAATVGRLRLPVAYALTGDRPSTDDAWRLAMSIPIDELTEPDFLSMANALADNGRADLAAATRMHLLTDYTQGRYTEQLYAQLKDEIASLPDDRKTDLASKLAKADHYDQALDLLQKIGATGPDLLALRMRSLFASRHYTQLLDETRGLTIDNPSLLLLRARAAWRDDKRDEFLAGLADIEQRFPASREATDAKIQRAKYYVTDVVDYAKSVDDLNRALAAGADGSDGENLWNLGWTYTLWGKYDDALRTFDAYVAKYPDGDWKTNSLFWSAKILDRLGRTAERDAKARQVVAEYPFSYYAYRAKELWPGIAAASSVTSVSSVIPSEARNPAIGSATGTTGGDSSPSSRLGMTAGRATPASSATATTPSTGASTAVFPDIATQLAQVTDPRLTTVRELLEIDLAREAAREMKAVAAVYPDNDGVQFMLADVYVRGGEPFKANGVLQRRFRTFVRHGGANIPRRFWEILFPLAYWDSIQKEATRQNLDPYLVASIIRQESGFEPTTVSNAGAVGLMQIMPEEAPRIAAAAGLPPVTREQLFDPATNIAIGAAEFRQKMNVMRDNVVLAIASYNAGEQAVGTWIATTPIDDIDAFVEAIPYAETRLYVKTVSRNRFEYRRIYEAPQQQGGPGR